MGGRICGILILFLLSFAFTGPTPAKAGTCWEEVSYSQWKVGCEAVRKLASGKYLLICCN